MRHLSRVPLECLSLLRDRERVCESLRPLKKPFLHHHCAFSVSTQGDKRSVLDITQIFNHNDGRLTITVVKLDQPLPGAQRQRLDLYKVRILETENKGIWGWEEPQREHTRVLRVAQKTL